MSRLVQWSMPVYNEFLKVAILTDDEKEMIEAHVIKHYSRVQKEIELCMSPTKVDEVMYSLKEKYWDATKFSPILKEAWIAPPLKKRKGKYIDEDTI